MSFQRFLGLLNGDRVPDARTMWLFQDSIIKKNLEYKLFERFHKYLDSLGLFVANGGRIIDSTFMEVPRQRNTREENERIKSGGGEELWKDGSG